MNTYVATVGTCTQSTQSARDLKEQEEAACFDGSIPSRKEAETEIK